MKKYFQKYLPDLIAVLLFAVTAIAYFIAPLGSGMVLTGDDHTGGTGSGHEMTEYMQNHGGERTRWTNSLFGGMPTYQMAPSYESGKVLNVIQKVYSLGVPREARYVFLMLLGFFIMLRCFGFKTWSSVLGAVMWAFSSYFFIIIAAGHIWKVFTLCYIPPTIGAMFLCYKGKYGPGIILAAIFMALQVVSNHVQMSYYFLFPIFFLSIGILVDQLRRKDISRAHAFRKWLCGSLAFAAGCMLGVAINLSNLYHTWEYQKESIRGKSELTAASVDESKQTSSGLDRDYITAWSYGIDETLTLLIPNAKGGASQPLTASKTAMKHAEKAYMPIYQQLGQYWGDQPMTSGPVYVGAFVVMLFVLGFFVLKGAGFWALVAATILSILLSWGRNFMWFTDLFLDYVPMYDKFRTVASILVIAEFTIPMIAVLAITRWMDMVQSDKQESRDKAWKAMLYSFGITAGICALFALVPDLFFGSYVSEMEYQGISGLAKHGIPVDSIFDNLNEMRRAVFRADCLRSLAVILAGTVLMWLFRAGKTGRKLSLVLITLVCLVDMWGVNKRYLNDSMFHKQRNVQAMFQKTEADQFILDDPELYFRTLDLTENTFNSNTASYWHKSIGGYHAAKLRRYQELIEHYISREIPVLQGLAIENGGDLSSADVHGAAPVLCMLNTRYMLMETEGGSKVPVFNPQAAGNAWFVKDLVYVNNADEELASLGFMDMRSTAVADKRFKESLGECEGNDMADSSWAVLNFYEANELRFDVSASADGVLVLSDIYYPGWTASLDGKEIPVGRVNYVLRALRVPQGEHSLVLRFDPKTIHVTETIAYSAYAILLLILAGLGVLYFIRLRKND